MSWIIVAVLIIFLLFQLWSIFFISTASTIVYIYEALNNPDDYVAAMHAAGVPYKKPACLDKKMYHTAFKICMYSLFSGILISSLFIVGVIFQARRFWPFYTQSSKQKTAIIFVHGLFHNSSAWLFFGKWFQKAGYAHQHCFAYSSFDKPFYEICQELDTFISKIHQQNPDEKIILVGHSLGGLLLRAWSATGTYTHLAKGIITLGSPHQGSKLALFGSGKLSQSIAHKSTLIESINKHEADSPSTLPKIALFSPHDNLVLPQSSLIPQNPDWKLVCLKNGSHGSMLFQKSCFSKVLAQIKQIDT